MSSERGFSYTVMEVIPQINSRIYKMERNQNGYPMPSPRAQEACEADLGGLPLAYAYVPIQCWRMLYSTEEALSHGTLFEELDKPLGVYGNE